MKKKYIFFTLAILFFPFLVFTAKGQNNTPVDSLSVYLNSIKSPSDTGNIEQVFYWLYKSSEDVLLKDYVMTKINQLKNKLDERDYYDLITTYFTRLVAINTKATNEKAITIGKQWLAANENIRSKYGYYSYLNILRGLRMPFRNTGRVNESIEYFASIEKKYLAAQDSGAISIVNNVLAGSYNRLGFMEKSRYYQLKSIAYLDNSQKDYSIAQSAQLLGLSGKVNRYAVLGGYYVAEKKPAIAENFLRQAIQFYNQLDSPMLMADAPYMFLQMARCKTLENSASSTSFYDTAWNYLNMYKRPPLEYAHYYLGKAADFMSKNLLDSALNNINTAIHLKDSFRLPITSYFGDFLPGFYKASILIKKGETKDAITLLKSEISELKLLSSNKMLIEELSLLAGAYSAIGKTQEAYQTLNEAFLLKEKLVNEQDDARSLNFETEKKIQDNEITIGILDAQNKANQKTKYYLFGIVGLLVLFVTGLAVFYSNKKKTNRELSLKNERLAYTIQQLQSTQAQLIQSEKMASLGELTAGIAHEIQNPLNFVNNFSEVSVELTKEMVDEVDKGNMGEVKSIADDLVQNLEKISHHGKRADAIVKGMLQHSRASSGQKEPTDINALCDEYLRLAYHGLRAKDKSFNATIKTDFDPSVGKINIISQDIGRVILNLITNAFYAVNEKRLTINEKQETAYEPIVEVSTKKEGNNVLISIKDNGTGIPDSIKQKIMQPFFTTKPTGQGTGLGLSLSYDIVKAHGGKIKMETREGEGTIFIIQIPA